MLVLPIDDWKCDQYRWYNNGSHKLPRSKPRVKKVFYKIDLPDGPSGVFRRHAYTLMPFPNKMVLIHYMGDESQAVDFPYGNMASSSKNYVRTCPSVLYDLKKKSITETPKSLYMSSLTQNPSDVHASVLDPRNIKQVQNCRFKALQSQRLSHDSLYNLHCLAYDMEDSYFLKIVTYPDLIVICGHQFLGQELNLILETNSPSPQLLSYDTTFLLGDFYVSSLCFRHVLFKENPVIPAFFMLHDRKLQYCHEQFFKSISEKVPNLRKNSTKPIVTDEEVGIINALRVVLPNTPRLRCWNHLIRASKRWLSSHGALSLDIAVYLSDLRSLLHSASEEEYQMSIKKMENKWSAAFFEYFVQNVHPNMSELGRWAIEKYSVYSPYSGVTSNQAESLNKVLKQLQSWKEAPIDSMVLSLHYLQCFYTVELHRGFNKLGNYNLHSMFSEVEFVPPIEASQHVIPPDKIVERIKAESINNDGFSERAEHRDEWNASASTTTSLPQQIASPALSQKEKARKVIEDGNITFEPKLSVFNVKGSNAVQVVQLFPVPKCSCPSSSNCYHILAAKMSLGYEESMLNNPLKKISLTQLKRNSRKPLKKSGRKKPRLGDYEIEPAADALSKGTSMWWHHFFEKKIPPLYHVHKPQCI